MKKLTKDERQIIGEALDKGKIDKQFIATRTDQELREWIEESDVKVNSRV